MVRPYLTLIIPAYNEERRIGATLQTLGDYFDQQPYTSEIIVVDDGSVDATLAVVEQARRDLPNLRIVANQHRGKAVAVQTGVFTASGSFIAFTDADLSTPITELPRLLQPVEAGAEVAIGSREGRGAKRHHEPLYRHLMGRGFNLLVRLVLGQPFADTQCGFKAFRHEAAKRLFRQSRLYTPQSPLLKRAAVTAFDVEILFLALRNGYRVSVVPVEWHYAPGSTVDPPRDAMRLLIDVLRVRWNDLRGHYDRAPVPEPVPAAHPDEEASHASV